MTPVAKISESFQLSGKGDGFTLSFDIVMIVPTIVTKEQIIFLLENKIKKTRKPKGQTTLIDNKEYINQLNSKPTRINILDILYYRH